MSRDRSIFNLVSKHAAQDSSAPQRSATGESKGLRYNHKSDDYAQGQDAWASVGKYFKSHLQNGTPPNPFQAKHAMDVSSQLRDHFLKTLGVDTKTGQAQWPGGNVPKTGAEADALYAREKGAVSLIPEAMRQGIIPDPSAPQQPAPAPAVPQQPAQGPVDPTQNEVAGDGMATAIQLAAAKQATSYQTPESTVYEDADGDPEKGDEECKTAESESSGQDAAASGSMSTGTLRSPADQIPTSTGLQEHNTAPDGQVAPKLNVGGGLDYQQAAARTAMNIPQTPNPLANPGLQTTTVKAAIEDVTAVEPPSIGELKSKANGMPTAAKGVNPTNQMQGKSIQPNAHATKIRQQLDKAIAGRGKIGMDKAGRFGWLGKILGKGNLTARPGTAVGAVFDYGAPAAVGGYTYHKSREAGLDPVTSALFGISGGSIAAPRDIARAVRLGRASSLARGESPVTGFLKEMMPAVGRKAGFAGLGLVPAVATNVAPAVANIRKTTENLAKSTEQGEGGANLGQIMDQVHGAMSNVERTTGETAQAASGFKYLPHLLAGGLGLGALGLGHSMYKDWRDERQEAEKDERRKERLAAGRASRRKRAPKIVLRKPGQYTIDYPDEEFKAAAAHAKAADCGVCPEDMAQGVAEGSRGPVSQSDVEALVRSKKDDRLMPPMFEQADKPSKCRVTVTRLVKKAYSGGGPGAGIGTSGMTTDVGMTETQADDAVRPDAAEHHPTTENDRFSMTGGGTRIASDISPLAVGFLDHCEMAGMNAMQVKEAIDRMETTFDDRTVAELRDGFQKRAFGGVLNFGSKALGAGAKALGLGGPKMSEAGRRLVNAAMGVKGQRRFNLGSTAAGAFAPEIGNALQGRGFESEMDWLDRRRLLLGAAGLGAGRLATGSPAARRMIANPAAGGLTGGFVGGGVDALARAAGYDTGGMGSRLGTMFGAASRLPWARRIAAANRGNVVGRGLRGAGRLANSPLGARAKGVEPLNRVRTGLELAPMFPGLLATAPAMAANLPTLTSDIRQGMQDTARDTLMNAAGGPSGMIDAVLADPQQREQVFNHLQQRMDADPRLKSEVFNRFAPGMGNLAVGARGFSDFVGGATRMMDPLLATIFGPEHVGRMTTTHKLMLGLGLLSTVTGGAGMAMGGGGLSKAMTLMGLLLAAGGVLGGRQRNTQTQGGNHPANAEIQRALTTGEVSPRAEIEYQMRQQVPGLAQRRAQQDPVARMAQQQTQDAEAAQERARQFNAVR